MLPWFAFDTARATAWVSQLKALKRPFSKLDAYTDYCLKLITGATAHLSVRQIAGQWSVHHDTAKKWIVEFEEAVIETWNLAALKIKPKFILAKAPELAGKYPPETSTPDPEQPSIGQPVTTEAVVSRSVVTPSQPSIGQPVTATHGEGVAMPWPPRTRASSSEEIKIRDSEETDTDAGDSKTPLPPKGDGGVVRPSVTATVEAERKRTRERQPEWKERFVGLCTERGSPAGGVWKELGQMAKSYPETVLKVAITQVLDMPQPPDAPLPYLRTVVKRAVERAFVAPTGPPVRSNANPYADDPTRNRYGGHQREMPSADEMNRLVGYTPIPAAVEEP